MIGDVRLFNFNTNLRDINRLIFISSAKVFDFLALLSNVNNFYSPAVLFEVESENKYVVIFHIFQNDFHHFHTHIGKSRTQKKRGPRWDPRYSKKGASNKTIWEEKL